MRFDHTRRSSLFEMAGAVRRLPPAKTARLNAFLMASGLMRTWSFNEITVRIAAFFKGTTIEDEWRLVFSVDGPFNEGATEEFIDHLLNGKDRFDPDSVGGFCAPELAKIEWFLDRLCYRVHEREAA